MTLFFDRNMGKAIPRALARLGLDVEWHDRHFPPNPPDPPASDDEILRMIGPNGWYMITCDHRVARSEPARRAFVDYGIGCFVLWGVSDKSRWDKARVIAYNWDHLRRLVANVDNRPFLCRLYPRYTPKLESLGVSKGKAA